MPAIMIKTLLLKKTQFCYHRGVDKGEEVNGYAEGKRHRPAKGR
jgi:hypothetical protein